MANTENQASIEASSIRFSYQPRVEISGADVAFGVSNYRFVYCGSDKLHSPGQIRYEHLLAVLNDEDKELLYVTAETNDLEGTSVVYLGRFDPRRHCTLTNSVALLQPEFFLPVASMVAREALNLPYQDYPLTEVEEAYLGAIPDVLKAIFPSGKHDDETLALLQQLTLGVMASPERAVL